MFEISNRVKAAQENGLKGGRPRFPRCPDCEVRLFRLTNKDWVCKKCRGLFEEIENDEKKDDDRNES